MLWLLADDSLDEDQREKALLDAEELKEDDLTLDQDKVELDLDDAPFLDEEEEEEEPVVPEEEEEEEREPRVKLDIKALLRDKRVLYGGIGGLVLLIAIILALLFWPSAEEPPPVPELPETGQEPVEEVPPLPTEHIVAFNPFWVEHVTEDGSVRLLYFKFSALTENEKLAWEMTHKKLVLRDAVFYYLKNKDLRFLSDKTKAEQLKKDLLSVINQYLNVDQVQELLIEEYLVK